MQPRPLWALQRLEKDQAEQVLPLVLLMGVGYRAMTCTVYAWQATVSLLSASQAERATRAQLEAELAAAQQAAAGAGASRGEAAAAAAAAEAARRGLEEAAAKLAAAQDARSRAAKEVCCAG